MGAEVTALVVSLAVVAVAGMARDTIIRIVGAKADVALSERVAKLEERVAEVDKRTKDTLARVQQRVRA